MTKIAASTFRWKLTFVGAAGTAATGATTGSGTIAGATATPASGSSGQYTIGNSPAKTRSHTKLGIISCIGKNSGQGRLRQAYPDVHRLLNFIRCFREAFRFMFVE